MDEFINALTFCETVQDHCSTLINVLTDIGGVARKAGVALSKKNSSVKDKVGIYFFQ